MLCVRSRFNWKKWWNSKCQVINLAYKLRRANDALAVCLVMIWHPIKLRTKLMILQSLAAKSIVCVCLFSLCVPLPFTWQSNRRMVTTLTNCFGFDRKLRATAFVFPHFLRFSFLFWHAAAYARHTINKQWFSFYCAAGLLLCQVRSVATPKNRNKYLHTKNFVS